MVLKSLDQTRPHKYDYGSCRVVPFAEPPVLGLTDPSHVTWHNVYLSKPNFNQFDVFGYVMPCRAFLK